jgi:hypothetical protein
MMNCQENVIEEEVRSSGDKHSLEHLSKVCSGLLLPRD